ncbi:(d)CMP kinase [Syntrophomonas palmitatica]|uniref:(d)CMP kinase n=1 Tax=Syntrophomonas palmitatica TaxID=402877 RepID=UPI0006D06B13|nr:(d)CMP kinase [Syntrophomonas palmitatica]
MKIAIDGPAGAGKSTIARLLARKTGYIYIDTGAMYRALTWKALQNNININSGEDLERLARETKIEFQYSLEDQKTICDGRDVSQEIRSPEVNAAVSVVAAYSGIRSIMVKLQQQMARNHSVVMDGRDIGECVLPDADYKFYLTASIEERARRRQKELLASGYDAEYDDIKNEIVARDLNDASREVGALKVLPDSIVIDTSECHVGEVLDKMLEIMKGT